MDWAAASSSCINGLYGSSDYADSRWLSLAEGACNRRKFLLCACLNGTAETSPAPTSSPVSRAPTHAPSRRPSTSPGTLGFLVYSSSQEVPTNFLGLYGSVASASPHYCAACSPTPASGCPSSTCSI